MSAEKSGLTQRAAMAVESEVMLSTRQIAAYINDDMNFMTPPFGLLREVERYAGRRLDALEGADFIYSLMANKGCAPESKETVDTWFRGDNAPNKDSAIKLCFALGLNAKSATEFLCKVCEQNGFNFRNAHEVTYYYALHNDLSYDDANGIIRRYETKIDKERAGYEVDATKRTKMIREIFADKLLDANKQIFLNRLCENKKNFIGYHKTASERLAELRTGVSVALIRLVFAGWTLENISQDILLKNMLIATKRLTEYKGDWFERFGKDLKSSRRSTDRLSQTWERYWAKLWWSDTETSVAFIEAVVSTEMLVKVVSTWFYQGNAKKRGRRAKPKEGGKNAKSKTYKNFPSLGNIYRLLNNPDIVFKSEQGRKVILYFYFCEYILNKLAAEYEEDVFESFCISAGLLLEECGLSPLYPAIRFDWLILKSVKIYDMRRDDYDPLEWFVEIAEVLSDRDICTSRGDGSIGRQREEPFTTR